MPAAGYSGTPLVNKLGIKPGLKIKLVNEPENYFSLFETNIREQLVKKNETPDIIHLFAKNRIEFESEMKRIKIFIKKNPVIIIWVSWDKKSQKSGLTLQKM